MPAIRSNEDLLGFRKKERNPLQRGYVVKDIGFTMGESVLSLSPIHGSEDNKIRSASE